MNIQPNVTCLRQKEYFEPVDKTEHPAADCRILFSSGSGEVANSYEVLATVCLGVKPHKDGKLVHHSKEIAFEVSNASSSKEARIAVLEQLQNYTSADLSGRIAEARAKIASLSEPAPLEAIPDRTPAPYSQMPDKYKREDMRAGSASASASASAQEQPAKPDQPSTSKPTKGSRPKDSRTPYERLMEMRQKKSPKE